MKAHLTHPPAGETARSASITQFMHSNSASAPLVPLIQGTKPMGQRLSATVSTQHLQNETLHPAGLQGTTAVAINNRPYFSFSSKFHPYGAAWRCDLHPCQKGGECYANNLHHDREVPRLHSLLHHVPKPLPDKPTSRRSPQMGFSLPSNTDQLSQADPPAPHHAPLSKGEQLLLGGPSMNN